MSEKNRQKVNLTTTGNAYEHKGKVSNILGQHKSVNNAEATN